MKQLSNKNMVDFLTMPMQDVVENLKCVANNLECILNDTEYELCLFGKNLTDVDIKKEIEETGDEYLKRELQYYFAIRAAIYHLETIYNRPASFI